MVRTIASDEDRIAGVLCDSVYTNALLDLSTGSADSLENFEDFLRLGPDPNTERENTLLMSSVPTTTLTISSSDYKGDKDYGLLFRSVTKPKTLTSKEMKILSLNRKQYYVYRGVLIKIGIERDTICVPRGTPHDGKPDLRTQVLMELHDTPMAGHRGENSTYEAVRYGRSYP